MTVFRRPNGWASKFVVNGRQHWVPGSPFPTKSAAREAEQRYRDRLNARRSEETCASHTAEGTMTDQPRQEQERIRRYQKHEIRGGWECVRYSDHLRTTHELQAALDAAEQRVAELEGGLREIADSPTGCVAGHSSRATALLDSGDSE